MISAKIGLVAFLVKNQCMKLFSIPHMVSFTHHFLAIHTSYIINLSPVWLLFVVENPLILFKAKISFPRSINLNADFFNASKGVNF